MNKKSAKEHAEFFAGSLQIMKRELAKSGGSFEENLMENGFTEGGFYKFWVKESVIAYVNKFPARFQRQTDFLSEFIEPNINNLRPSIIPEVIIKYGCSSFDSLCEGLREKGDDRGSAWIMIMNNIIEDAFHGKGLGHVLTL